MSWKVTRVLYKSCLQMCRDMGFKYGSRDPSLIVPNYENITFKSLRNMVKHKRIGRFLGNNIIYHTRVNSRYINCEDYNLDEFFEIFKLTGYFRDLHMKRFGNKVYII